MSAKPQQISPMASAENDRGDERLGPGQGVGESLDRALMLRIGVGEVAKVAVLEQLEAVEKNFEPQLDLVCVDAAARHRQGADPFDEAGELRRRLAGKPGDVVPRRLPQGLLPLADDHRRVDGRRREQGDDPG